METVGITVDEIRVSVRPGSTVLEAARGAGIYIPTLCHHPDVPCASDVKVSVRIFRGERFFESQDMDKELEGCRLCIVEVEGQTLFAAACCTEVVPGMVVRTNTPSIQEERRDKLSRILAKHPHACLTCAQREGCTREPCSTNVPKDERCCAKFGNCELQKVADYVGIKADTPRYVPKKEPVICDEPLIARDYSLCISCTRCVRMCRDTRGIDALGVAFDGASFIAGSKAKTLRESQCKFCGACIGVCPTGALMDKDVKILDEASLVPCRGNCPVGMNIPRFLRYISRGEHAKAVAVMRERTPLSSVLAYACFHPCENVCRRESVNEPVAICSLKRHSVANDPTNWKRVKMAQPTGKKVAVVGSGPSGLTAAYYLANKGHSVTIFEAMPGPGGMMRYGIPDYRLPRDIVLRDVDAIFSKGVEFKFNIRVGQDIAFAQLSSLYNAVFIAMGAQLSRRIEVEGAEGENVLWGLDFLRDVKLGKDVSVNEKVVVIGGGNVAVDVALTALRRGAKEVQLVCLECGEEMPAFDREIEEAIEEGIVIRNSWGPKRILREGGKVTGIELKRCTSVFDEDKRFNPKYDENETMVLPTDMVILAIGQSSDLSALEFATQKIKCMRGLVAVNDNLETSFPGVFAGGEVARGPSSIVECTAQGRKAAIAMDRYLGGDGNIDESLIGEDVYEPYFGREEGFAERPRAQMPKMPLEERLRSLGEIELGYDKEKAEYESKRCLKCDFRLRISPVQIPPEKYLAFTLENVMKSPESEGAYELLDEKKQVIYIAGTAELRKALKEGLEKYPKARFFTWEEDKMFTKRESELLQQYLQKHGKMPEGNDELGDLF